MTKSQWNRDLPVLEKKKSERAAEQIDARLSDLAIRVDALLARIKEGRAEA